MYAPVRVNAPASPPLTLAEVKAHCRVDGTDEDVLLEALLASAVDHLDGYGGILGRAIVAQTWRPDFDGFESVLRLPLPASSIEKISWRNRDDVSVDLDPASYVLRTDSLGSYARMADSFSSPAGLASSAAVSVAYIAGTAPADVPPAIKAAILLLVGHWYVNREAASSGSLSAVPLAFDALIAAHCRFGV